MTLIERLGLKVLHLCDPEQAHRASLAILRWGLVRLPGLHTSPRLVTRVGGLELPNPVGLAAGYDKNAVVLAPLAKAGFGFLEVGAATPLPQIGNPKPRLFRLNTDQAIINRFGFNNDGAHAIVARLARAKKTRIPLGLNLGANKDSADRAQDFGKVLIQAAPFVDFATINISSPNTDKLRDLQEKAALEDLLARVSEINQALTNGPLPIFLKIAPDLCDGEIQDIATLALRFSLSAIICTNTTLARDGVTHPHQFQSGGLSGRPLFKKSTRVLAKMSHATGGQIDLIGVGGIASPRDAFAKIEAGAKAVQLYSAMVYKGMSLVAGVVTGLDRIAEAEGLSNLSQATGRAVDGWLS